MRHRFLPVTAGDWQGLPERVLAPQRKLDSIGTVLCIEPFTLSLSFFATHVVRTISERGHHASGI